MKHNQKILVALFMGITSTLTFCSAEEEAKLEHDLYPNQNYEQECNPSIAHTNARIAKATLQFHQEMRNIYQSKEQDPNLNIAKKTLEFHQQITALLQQLSPRKSKSPEIAPDQTASLSQEHLTAQEIATLPQNLRQAPSRLDDIIDAHFEDKMGHRFECLFLMYPDPQPKSPEELAEMRAFEIAQEAQINKVEPIPSFGFEVFSTNETLHVPFGSRIKLEVNSESKNKNGQSFATTNPDEWGFTKPEITNSANLKMGTFGYSSNVNKANEIENTLFFTLTAMKRGTSRITLDKKEDGTSQYWVDIIIE